MSGIRNVVLLMVCLGSILLAGNRAAQDSRPGEVVSGISVTREEAAPHHLRVEVCGPDATRLRPGFPLVFELSVPVRGIVVRNGDAGMMVGASAEGQTATVTLTRDPFIPPAPWRVVVLLSVAGSLGEGHIVVGAARVPLPTPLPAGHATVVLGTGCDERYAGQGAPPGGPGEPIDTCGTREVPAPPTRSADGGIAILDPSVRSRLTMLYFHALVFGFA